MSNTKWDMCTMVEPCSSADIPSALSLARTLAAALEAHPRASMNLDLRLARALTLDVIDLLGGVDEPSM